jgi:hypothetical protein
MRVSVANYGTLCKKGGKPVQKGTRIILAFSLCLSLVFIGYLSFTAYRRTHAVTPSLVDTVAELPVTSPEWQAALLNAELQYYRYNAQAPNQLKTFTVKDGITPGKQLVLLTLYAPNAAHYTVTVGGERLTYLSAHNCFYGEVTEGLAHRRNVRIIP